MKFNWIFSKKEAQNRQKQIIELEYQLRPKITKFLMEHLEQECCGDFSCFHFDFDMNTKWVWISEKTPKNYLTKIRRDFDIEINGSQNFSSVG
ncbi:hypothetical protein [Croceitalea rosinachiae]|uniref:Uncharacterized protein n=1 Tax=Croceitalea rosinachiae TaxID=3075596 RepID=A0ABU3AD05_9FLAO|nr:hypothetical protein [Croceitalea sp. F388]MDT0608061.1 hypothetical protein [Croceitalea sp. F388]